MNVEELWNSIPSASSCAAAAMQPSKFYTEGGYDTWEYFPCPFCYVEVEVTVLCAHLQEEHCFDARNAVCPVCAADLGKDMIGHITMQHSHLLKRRKSQRTSSWTSGPLSTEKESHELSFHHGPITTNRRGNTLDSSPDPLISSFIYNISFPDSKSDQEANSDLGARDASSLHVQSQSLESSASNQVLDHDYAERSRRAEFVQQMLLWTLF